MGYDPFISKRISEELWGERVRQVGEEGWTPEHDDEHDLGELAWAASAYLTGDESYWPDGWTPFKGAASVYPERRRDLVKAGALIIAEIERYDRARAKEG